VLLGNWSGTPALNWEFRCFLPSRNKGMPRRLRALSLRLSSNVLTQFWSAGKETFTRPPADRRARREERLADDVSVPRLRRGRGANGVCRRSRRAAQAHG